MKWTPDLVGARLLNAARVFGKDEGPRGYGRRGELETGIRTGFDAHRAAGQLRGDARISASAEHVSRAGDAALWPAKYLARYDDLRAVVRLKVQSQIKRQKFSDACAVAGMSVRTGHRQLKAALTLIAEGLNRDRVRVEL